MEPPQLEMYHLRDGQNNPVDLDEVDDLANEASARYNDPTIAARRAELAQRLAALGAERLRPLNASDLYRPRIQTRSPQQR